MRRSFRQRVPRTSSISAMPRVMSMIAMLAVLAMLIYRARDPATWRWLARMDGEQSAADRGPAVLSNQGAAGSGQAAATAPVANPKTPIANPKSPPVAPPEPVATGPTDEDAEQADAFKEERQVIADRTLAMQREEMPAYDRVVGWVVDQPFSVLRKRAHTDITFNDLIQSPDKHRGQLIELELNVQLLRKIEEQIPSGEQLYEAWGFTTDSGSWLYDSIVVDLPKGMPVGTRISEQGRFVGYFFKVQAYLPALAKPRDPPQLAPMLIGRLVWKQIEQPKVQQSDWMWGYVLLGGFVLIAAVNLGIMYRRSRRRPGALLATATSKPRQVSVDDWLEQAGAGEAPLDDTPADPPQNLPRAADPRTGNGDGQAFPEETDGREPGAE